jgi:hypothetical protein
MKNKSAQKLKAPKANHADQRARFAESHKQAEAEEAPDAMDRTFLDFAGHSQILAARFDLSD